MAKVPTVYDKAQQTQKNAFPESFRFKGKHDVAFGPCSTPILPVGTNNIVQ
ncbi:hypothetical protein KIN20_037752 [Parelaphostrongylus tenuis]|uniref:Uncharacterized protein n=1 Tax=Parelaphostrongylus tenuis TaxID=148309 RepID=A0AAD5REI3_PARTN|nr:hypothetical protein KIN20_037752 [Parelaphostrongylus tenuis]